MKKVFILAVLSVFMIGSGSGQVFYSGFENWSDPNTPSDWFGAATNATSANVFQYSTSTQEGSFAVKLVNQTTSHKRFSTLAVSVTSGEVYNVSYYARGTGQVRTGMYRGATGSYASYSSYAVVNSTSWTKITQTIIADTTSSAAEFILSFHSTTSATEDLQIDSFMVSVGSSSSVSIYDIQHTSADTSDYYGDPVNTGGIVSAVKSGAYWIQNGSGPWSGVYVYDSNNSPAIGDSVTFSAIVDEYYGLTELKSISSFTVVSSGNTVEVTPITLADGALESYEGVLVEVSDAACESLPDTYLEWVVGDGFDQLKIGDLMYAYTPVVGTHYDITGVMDYSFSERKLQPRSVTDVTVHNGIDESVQLISVYPNPSSDFIQVTQNMRGTLSISDVSGRVVYSAPFAEQASIEVGQLDSGVYQLVINGQDGQIAVARILID